MQGPLMAFDPTTLRLSPTRGDETRLWNLQGQPTPVSGGAGQGSARLEAGWTPRPSWGGQDRPLGRGTAGLAPSAGHAVGDGDGGGDQAEQQRKQQPPARVGALGRRAQ